MTTEQQELKPLDYIRKFSERLTLTLIKIYDCKEISEEEELLLKEVFRIQWLGNYPLYVTKLALPDETTTEQGLFSQNVSSTSNGMVIEQAVSEPKQ